MANHPAGRGIRPSVKKKSLSLVLVAVLAAAAALAPLLPAHPAEAGAPLCEGRPATLVGSPGAAHLAGTAGADVVVTNGAYRVETGDGDDLVCVTGATPDGKRMFVYAGAGNDLVTVTAHNGVRALLGDGDDIFHGHSETDAVLAGDLDDSDGSHFDTGVDTIHTGAGPDNVRSWGGEDTISLGLGADTLEWGSATKPAQGGRGRDKLRIYAGAADAVLDNSTNAPTLTAGTEVLSRWSSFADFEIGGQVTLVLGSAVDETFSRAIHDTPSTHWTIRAGWGDDVLQGTPGDDVLLGGQGRDRADGGPGRDRCVVERRHNCESR